MADFSNPLQYLSPSDQMLPAYFILAMLPIDQKNPAAVAMQQKHEALWTAGLARMQGNANARKYEEVTF